MPACPFAATHRVHQPPEACDHEAVLVSWAGDHRKIRRPLPALPGAAFFGGPKKSLGLFRALQSTHKLYDIIWSQVLHALVTEWSGMNSNPLKYTATDIKDLLLDYIDTSACDTS